MRRYDGMDELLQSVRDRVGADKSRVEAAKPEEPFTFVMPGQAEAYRTVVARLGLLLREAEQLRERLVAEEGSSLGEDQRDHLLALLGQVMEELWTCEATLQGVR